VGLTLRRSGWLPVNLFSKQVPETFREPARNLIDQLQLFRFLDNRRQSQRKRLRQLIGAINRAERGVKKRVGESACRRVGGGEETGRRVGVSAGRRGEETGRRIGGRDALLRVRRCESRRVFLPLLRYRS
jgi:hypothetical protein